MLHAQGASPWKGTLRQPRRPGPRCPHPHSALPPHLSEASFRMLPRESMQRLCWPMDEVRPAGGWQARAGISSWATSRLLTQRLANGSLGEACWWRVEHEEQAWCAADPSLPRLGNPALAARRLEDAQRPARRAPVLSSWPCLNTLERAKPRPSSSTERVSTPTWGSWGWWWVGGGG